MWRLAKSIHSPVAKTRVRLQAARQTVLDLAESLIQYTNQDDDLSGNIRFGWLDTAGTGLFLVYNEVRQTVSPTGPQDRAFIVKFTRQLNLLH